jgi:acyl-coenzyme A thioesterase PaaI-like protein
MKARVLKRLMNIWPPFVGAGIKVLRIADDFREIEVALRQKWFNKNIVGSHFGGSLYAMVDPFYMLMLMNILGRDYIVWDKFASIDFIAPGKGTVTATFSLDKTQIETIMSETGKCEKYVAVLPVVIKNEKDEIVATASKHIYVRLKKRVCLTDDR